MSKVSDYVQNLAESFGERFFLQNAWAAYENAQSAGLKALLEKILRLHMITYLKQNTGFYLTNQLMTVEAAKNIEEAYTGAVKDLVPHINDCIEAFDFVTPIETLPTIAKQDYWKHAGTATTEVGTKFDFTKVVGRPKM